MPERDMKQLLSFTVPGRPVAKGRPRFSRSGHVYTPETTRSAEEVMQDEMRKVCSKPFAGPLELALYFCFRRPDRWPKAYREEVDDGAEPWFEGKPDLDNLVKLVKDSANGILWFDDSQVVDLEACKLYSAENETQIRLKTLEREGLPPLHSSKPRGSRGGKQ